MKTFTTVLKWIFGVGAVLLIIVGGAVAFLYPSLKEWAENMGGNQNAREVRTLAAAPGRLVRTVSAPGEIEPRRRVQISARVSALIRELPFEEGDEVQAGDVVVRLDDGDLQAALDQAIAQLRADEARLSGARASHVMAVAEWERVSSLYESNDLSKADLDAVEAELRRAESNLLASEQNIEASRAIVGQRQESLRYATITSPISGRLTKLNAEVGELVVTGTMNNAGTVILEVADLSELLIKAEVAESDVAPVRAGQTARVYINAYQGEVFEGTVERVALQHTLAADRSKYFETEILLHLPDGRTLFSGLTATVDIEVETIEGVILVPSQAVVDKRVDELPTDVAGSEAIDPNKTFTRMVYVVKEGRATATPVQIGASDLTQTAVLAGLSEGESVIVGPWAAIQAVEHKEAVREAEPIGETETESEVAGSEAEAAEPSSAPGGTDGLAAAPEKPASS